MSRAPLRTVLLVLILCSAGCGKKAVGEGEQAGSAVEFAAPTADFSLTSTAFVEEIKKDTPAAKAKYGGKIVEVSGEVIYVSRDVAGGTWLMLEPRGETFQYFTRDKQPWLKHANGQKVTLRGKYDGIGGLVDCVIKKYGQKHLIVTGVITEKTADDLHADIFLKGDGQTRIRCNALAANAELRPLKPGQRVTLIGEFSKYYGNAETAGLTSCHLVP